ncbi:hypothetical protein B6S59_25455 [Pseudomonas sp. A46]|nr:hypothetical protein [Pseudomonas sp. A46]OWJ91121.1 hypothetical protein B6S59_25455 [Pseudomonas sp. A46]
MAFVSGVANSMAELLAAFTTALTSNGWSVDGDIYYKGSTFARIRLVTGETGGDNRMIQVLGGTGRSAGALTGAAPWGPRIGFASGETWTFPINFAIHILTAPDEVYLITNRNVDTYDWAAFGAGNVAGLPGTGMWATASLGDNYFVSTGAEISATSGGNGTSIASSRAPFWQTVTDNRLRNAVLHHGLDGGNWADTTELRGMLAAAPHIARSPNAWNGESVLLPIQLYVSRPSSKRSIVGDLAHARYLRIDNYDPTEVIPLGPDQWRVYPFFRKDTANRNGGGGNTGTFGWAIRYDGP